jgi:hypothetical protein
MIWPFAEESFASLSVTLNTMRFLPRKAVIIMVSPTRWGVDGSGEILVIGDILASAT